MNKLLKNIKTNYKYIFIVIIYFVIALLLNPINKEIIANQYIYTYIYIVYWALAGLLFLASIFFTIYILKDSADEKMFLKIAIILGIFFIVYTMFPHEIDEKQHYFRTFMIGNFKIYNEQNESGELGGYVPNNFETKFAPAIILLKNHSLITEKLNWNDMSFIAENFFGDKIPFTYIVPAIGIILANILHVSRYFYIIFARFAVYIFYVYCSYISIKNMKYYKKTMFSICLIPVMMWLAGTVHSDPILNGACFVFITTILKYYFDDDENFISKRDLIYIVISAILLMSVKKLIYTPILLLFFLIPKSKFKTTKKYSLFIAVSIVIGISLILWQLLFLSPKYAKKEGIRPTVNESMQIDYTKQNPVLVSRTIIKAMLKYGITYLVNYGHYSYGLNQSAVNVVAQSIGFTLVLNCILDDTKYKENDKKKKILNIIFVLLFLFLLAASIYGLYVCFTDVGFNEVMGYQPRYTIPILLFILIPISNAFCNVKNDLRNYNKNLAFIMFMLNVDLVMALIVEVFNKYIYF